MYEAIVLEKAGEAVVKQLDEAGLPADGDVTVRVVASTLNYKDGLAITGKSGVIRTFPMTPGSIWPASSRRAAAPPSRRVIACCSTDGAWARRTRAVWRRRPRSRPSGCRSSR